jgi:hypothetical protein
MRKWLSVLRYPVAYPKCRPARARRNLLRLAARHPEVAGKLGISVVGIYAL